MHALVRILTTVALAAGLAAGLPASARAQATPPPAGGAAPASASPSPSPLADIQRAEAVSITATRIEEPLERVGASVSIVPDEVIEVQQYRSVDEALRSLPGLSVLTSGSPGKLTTVSIRGANASQIQVLIDGVRVKSATSGDFDFSDLTTDAIERIEVVRGPQSTLYGADAMGGVINIITKRGRGAPQGFVDLEGGNYETFRVRAGASGAVGPLSFSLGVSRLEFGGQFDNDEHDLTSVNGRVAYALPNQGEVALVGRYSDSHKGIPFATVFPDFDKNREQDDTFTLASLEWRQPWVAWYETSLRLSLVNTDLVFKDPDSLFETRSELETERREADLLQIFRTGPFGTITVGGEYRHEKGISQGVFDNTIESWAVFLQEELALFDRLFLTGGVRHDGNDTFEDKTTFRAAASFLVKETDSRLKASWGQGFRAPTFNDLFFPATFPPCPAFGNPSLKPEESESWDGGVEQYLWARRIKLGATYFRNDFENLIQAQLIDAANFCFQARNVGQARTQGAEVEASVNPIDSLLLTAAYTYTDTEDLTTGQELRRFPKNRLGLTAAWEALPGLMVSGELLVASSQFEGAGRPRTDGYTVVNAGASYKLARRWGWLSNVVFHVKVNNVFNEDYEEVQGFPALGTWVVGGIRATFD
jgi:vitamin B12 transporter